MTRTFDLPKTDDGEEAALYQLPTLALSDEVAVTAELEVWHDDDTRPEVILSGDLATDGDLCRFLTTETEKKIDDHLSALGLRVVSVSPRESGAQSPDQILFNVEIQ